MVSPVSRTWSVDVERSRDKAAGRLILIRDQDELSRLGGRSPLAGELRILNRPQAGSDQRLTCASS